MVKPLKPEEIIDSLDKIIHPSIIIAVNNLLKKNYRGTSITIKQKDIVEEVLTIGSIARDEIFDGNHLDFENLFKNYGWDVKHDSPAYNEDYEAYYTFSKKTTS